MYNFKCVSFINSLLINLYNIYALSLSNKKKSSYQVAILKIKNIFNKKIFQLFIFKD